MESTGKERGEVIYERQQYKVNFSVSWILLKHLFGNVLQIKKADDPGLPMMHGVLYITEFGGETTKDFAWDSTPETFLEYNARVLYMQWFLRENGFGEMDSSVSYFWRDYI